MDELVTSMLAVMGRVYRQQVDLQLVPRETEVEGVQSLKEILAARSVPPVAPRRPFNPRWAIFGGLAAGLLLGLLWLLR